MNKRQGRTTDQLREVKVTFDAFGYSSGSVLFEIGKTKVLCSVNLNLGVPSFLKGRKMGWLTAEYSMLPSSTSTRMKREISSMRRNGRSVEISRLIGRSLRAIVDFSLLGERTIIVDCDVLQADGGTRVACITGSCIALQVAVNNWLKNKIIRKNILTDSIAAISVGIVSGVPFLDVDFSEDRVAEADFNFVITKSNKIIEIQGAAEGAAISWDQFEKARVIALSGIEQLFKIGEEYFSETISVTEDIKQGSKKCTPFFSLKNRQNLEI